MRLGKDLLDKPIISVTDKRMVGKVKDGRLQFTQS
jgi:hypothetical protein